MSFGREFRFTLLTADPEFASEGDKAGIDRIGVDLERLGKAERQAGFEGRLSHHDWEDLSKVSSRLEHAQGFARLNSPNPDSEREIETAIERGARVLMLPYFTSAAEAEAFVVRVRRRARTVLLIETARAVVGVREIFAVAGVDEAMVGLNDMRIQFRAASHFEILASPIMELIAREAERAGIDFSIGGLGRWNDPRLPIDPDLIYAQYPRLGAKGAWLARSFFDGRPAGSDLAADIDEARARLDFWAAQPIEKLEEARDALMRQARETPLKHDA